MAEADKDLQKAVDEHLKRLYEQYKSNNKIFTATHIGHLSLSIVFVLSILLPFFYLQIGAHDTNAEMRRLSQNISQQEQNVAVYRKAITGLKRVFTAVENTPKPLEGYIQALEKEAAGGPTAAMPGDLKAPPETCGSPSDKGKWMECRIRQYMAASAVHWQEILTNEIAAPLQTLNIKEFDQWKADLQAGMRKHAEQARAEMAANPNFWLEFNQGSPIYRSMVDGVHRFWADHRFEEISRRMEESAAGWRVGVEKLNKKKEDIQKSEESLNNALKNIKTRFGKLGLELEDSILLAPVAFSAIFLVAALNLCKNIQLRKSFHRLFQARDPQKVALTDSEIALAMPLWLDPLAP
jgi:cell division protein FtsB